MKRQYRLHELEDTEFEDLVCRICMRILGMGTIAFSAGKDVSDGGSSFNSALNFNFVGKDLKNRINRLSKSYYAYIQQDSLPHFRRIKTFLEDPRNDRLKAMYHDTADELKQKIVTFRGEFESFDEVLTHVRDLIATPENRLAGKKRLVNLFLHYMYCNCDIGDHAKAN